MLWHLYALLSAGARVRRVRHPTLIAASLRRSEHRDLFARRIRAQLKVRRLRPVDRPGRDWYRRSTVDSHHGRPIARRSGCHPAAVMDMYSRRKVGWVMDDHVRSERRWQQQPIEHAISRGLDPSL
jgi:transposase InsO family protein